MKDITAVRVISLSQAPVLQEDKDSQSKHYFEVHIAGRESPWILRALTDVSMKHVLRTYSHVNVCTVDP